MSGGNGSDTQAPFSGALSCIAHRTMALKLRTPRNLALSVQSVGYLHGEKSPRGQHEVVKACRRNNRYQTDTSKTVPCHASASRRRSQPKQRRQDHLAHYTYTCNASSTRRRHPSISITTAPTPCAVISLTPQECQGDAEFRSLAASTEEENTKQARPPREKGLTIKPARAAGRVQ